jgi:uncharacterized protein YkwD
MQTFLMLCYIFALGLQTPNENRIATTQNTQVQQTTCISAQEYKLYELIMQYRASKNLPKIPLSTSLTLVAQIHCKDLMENPPQLPCNMHSWSKKGAWEACCYTPDHKQAAGMWSKPKELSQYVGNGYEIASWSSAVATPEASLEGWKKSSGHNAVIINQGIWKSSAWNAIGVGIVGNYAVVWFGVETDPAGIPKQCKK